jgi:fatty acid synthase subunit beta
MPFDGILLASRMMVTAEAASSIEVKELIVATPGIADERSWEGSYEAVAGGVATVNSELGEPIHKIANRGILLWRELEKELFSLPRDKRAAAVAAKKDYYIARINADFQKVYFGRRADGTVTDVQNMTYAEARVVEINKMPV